MKKMKKMKKILVASLLLAGISFAAKIETPNKIDTLNDSVVLVTVSEAKSLYDSGAQFIDARPTIDFSKERIKGAVSAGYKGKGGKKNRKVGFDSSKDKFKTQNITTDKSKTIIAYCASQFCWKSYKAVSVLTKDGYTDVKWMRNGIKAWKAAGNPVE